MDHRDDPANHSEKALQSLCRTHHDKKTQWEARAGRARKKPKKRPPEAPPGRLR